MARKAGNRLKPAPKRPATKGSFRPGQSGNPSGISSEARRLVEEIREAALMVLAEPGRDKKTSRLFSILRNLAERAAGWDRDAAGCARELLNRAYGQAPQSMDLTSKGEALAAMNVLDVIVIGATEPGK